MTLYKKFKKEKKHTRIRLTYSALAWLGGNPKWFCRVWSIGNTGIPFIKGEAYHKNKFTAYRMAMNGNQIDRLL